MRREPYGGERDRGTEGQRGELEGQLRRRLKKVQQASTHTNTHTHIFLRLGVFESFQIVLLIIKTDITIFQTLPTALHKYKPPTNLSAQPHNVHTYLLLRL